MAPSLVVAVKCPDSTLLPRYGSRRGRAPAQRAAGAGPRVLAVTGHRRAVDENGADACGEAAGVVVGRDIGDGGWIEDDQVGEGAGPDRAAVHEAELGRGQARHLVDGGGQVEHPLVAHVVAEDTRKAAVEPGVWLAPCGGHAV